MSTILFEILDVTSTPVTQISKAKFVYYKFKMYINISFSETIVYKDNRYFIGFVNNAYI